MVAAFSERKKQHLQENQRLLLCMSLGKKEFNLYDVDCLYKATLTLVNGDRQ